MPLQILETRRAHAILSRMAWQLHEQNYGAPALNLLGVSIRGQVLAQRLAAELRQIQSAAVYLAAADNPDWQQALALVPEHPLVVVDDVLYTGGTLFKTLLAAADAPCSQLQVCVLIDRGHRARPVVPDVVGLELATTLQEYVRVTVTPDGSDIAAYLD